MTIVITGATGFLGRYLVAELSGHNLCLLGRSMARLRSAFPVSSPLMELIETDYRGDNLKASIRSADAVVHLAAVRFRPEFQSLNDYSDNIMISETLFRACADEAASNVVLASSRGIYSESVNRLPFVEDERVMPPTLYGISKFTMECLGFCRYGLNLKCLRFAQLMGVGERTGFLLMTLIERARRGEPLVVFGAGRGEREYLYVKDAAAGIRAALEHPAARGVFNMGSGLSVSHAQLAFTISQVFTAGHGPVVFDPKKEESLERTLMDSRKARDVLGWTPRWTLEAALADMKRTYAQPSG